MSETSNETPVADAAVKTTKPKKDPPVETKVTLSDGREVVFVGKRRMLKDSAVEGTQVTTTFDFVNGQTRKITIDLTDALAPKFLGHGIEQKVGDETAGDTSVDDMILHVDAILERLGKGEWGVERGAGSEFAGASVVIRAIMEATGKDQAFVKGFLDKKLEAGKEAGLTRQKLYAGFKAPGTKTAVIIQRMEAEKAAKDSGIDGDAALEEMTNS